MGRKDRVKKGRKEGGGTGGGGFQQKEGVGKYMGERHCTMQYTTFVG